MTFDDAVYHYAPTLRRRANALAARVGIIEADDLLQETWFTAWRQWPWVIAVGENVVRARLFHILGQQFSAMLRRLNAQRRSGSLPDPDTVAPDDQHKVAEARETARALSKMRRPWREVLAALAAGFTQEEIAERDGVTKQAIQHRMKNGRQALLAAGYGV